MAMHITNHSPVRRLVILGTGGTIAGKADQAADHVGYRAAQISVSDLVAQAPQLAAWPLEVEQVAQIDSKDMDLSVWQHLSARVAFHLERTEVAAVLITHGTDTLEETAFLLERVLQPAKPVVLTCAMRPATALMPDGPQNLQDAAAVAMHPGARGVLVVCAGQIHGAHDVAKVHTYRLDAFDSGDAGPLGCVEEGGVRQFRSWAGSDASPSDRAAMFRRFLAADALPRVALVTSHADADGMLVRALLMQGASHPLRGIVVAGTGNGTLHHALHASLLEAEAQGVRVVRASRCVRGRVISHAGQSFPDSNGLSAVKARLGLALTLLGP